MNKYVLICHCLLDPLTRARGTKKITRNIIKILIDEDISIIQLPCPELMDGFFREPCSKEDYDTPEYREHCKKIALTVAQTVIQYSPFEVIGLISVGGSPSCGCQRTHIKGEHVREPGIFIEELQAVFETQGINLPIVDHELVTSKSNLKQFLSL